VASLMNRVAAMSALLEPLATSSRTSTSRPVRASVAAHVQGGLAVHVGQSHGHPPGTRVPGHVGQGLLG
jgi:hypothetical protein